MSRTGFLGRAGHLGLGELVVSFGLGPLTFTPVPPPTPPSIVTLPGFFGPTASSDEKNAAAIYARGGGLGPLFEFPPIPTGPSPASSDGNAAPIYARGGAPEPDKVEDITLALEPKSAEANAAPIYGRGAAQTPQEPTPPAEPSPTSSETNSAPIYIRKKTDGG